MHLNGFDFADRTEPPPSSVLADAWRPYFDATMEAFGSVRCMFESNFPVGKGSYSYRAFWNACKRMIAGLPEADKTNLFAGTAAHIYRLDEIAISGQSSP